MDKTLIVILGPTASGKTELAIDLARHFDTEIISTDSRQFYREMNIGTAKPSIGQLAQAKHHFINHLSVTDSYSAGDFEKEALETAKKIFNQKNYCIAVGGSGLYIKVLCEGLDDFPEVNDDIKQEIQMQFEQKGIQYLQEELKQKDPEYYKTVDLQNPHRLMRALAVCESSGKPFSSFRQNQSKKRPFAIKKIGIEIPRQKLYERINQRVDKMIEYGLLEEVKSLKSFWENKALDTVGYREFMDYLNNKITYEKAMELIKRNSRRYAKRQMTWFRKVGDMHWFEPAKIDKIIEFIESGNSKWPIV
jgi:tRNA dimethylallyltransferase